MNHGNDLLRNVTGRRLRQYPRADRERARLALGFALLGLHEDAEAWAGAVEDSELRAFVEGRVAGERT